MIEFRDVCLKEKEKCMCEVFKKKKSLLHACGKGWNVMKRCSERHRKLKRKPKESSSGEIGGTVEPLSGPLV